MEHEGTRGIFGRTTKSNWCPRLDSGLPKAQKDYCSVSIARINHNVIDNVAIEEFTHTHTDADPHTHSSCSTSRQRLQSHMVFTPPLHKPPDVPPSSLRLSLKPSRLPTICFFVLLMLKLVCYWYFFCCFFIGSEGMGRGGGALPSICLLSPFCSPLVAIKDCVTQLTRTPRVCTWRGKRMGCIYKRQTDNALESEVMIENSTSTRAPQRPVSHCTLMKSKQRCSWDGPRSGFDERQPPTHGCAITELVAVVKAGCGIHWFEVMLENVSQCQQAVWTTFIHHTERRERKDHTDGREPDKCWFSPHAGLHGM